MCKALNLCADDARCSVSRPQMSGTIAKIQFYEKKLCICQLHIQQDTGKETVLLPDVQVFDKIGGAYFGVMY